jgi:hypothetical protein
MVGLFNETILQDRPLFHNHDSILVQEYASLGAPYLAEVPATPLRTEASLLHLNTTLAQEIGLDAQHLASAEGINTLSGNTPFPGYQSRASYNSRGPAQRLILATPMAVRYCDRPSGNTWPRKPCRLWVFQQRVPSA